MDTIKVKLLEALIEAKGIVTTACKKADQPRSTFYLWYNGDNEFKEAVDDIQNICLDFVEEKLHDLIGKNDTAATIFYLKTKGRKRGFIERADDTPPAIIINTTVTKEEAIDIYKTINSQC